MADIPIKPASVDRFPTTVPVGPPGAESSKERSRLERVADSFKKIQIPELIKALKEAITQKSSQQIPGAGFKGKSGPLDRLETKMVERFTEGKSFGEPVPPGTEVFAEKSDLQCYEMLEKKLAPYTEERRVHPQSIVKAIHRGLYKKSGTKDQLLLFADVVIQKGEKTKTEKMTRIPLEGEGMAKALQSRQAPGTNVDPGLLANLQSGDELVYLALSHKVVKPELAAESEVAMAELARAKADQPEKADRGRFSFSRRAEGMAQAHVSRPMTSPVVEPRPAETPRWQVRAVWLLLGATLLLSLLYWLGG